MESHQDVVSNNNQWEAMLLQNVTNHTELKFPNFKKILIIH